MVDLVKRGAKIKMAFAKKKLAPKFKGITIKADGAYFETYSSLTFALHFDDGTTHWATPQSVKINASTDAFACTQLEIAWRLRDMADRIEADYRKFSENFDGSAP